ncbi:MAG: HAMP domain-containing sensor histidine kinase [Eubacteriales bacterium]|nr:HAMP domain-containing sensor histidine kinase [Eubacteriales bacterium]
MTQILPAVYVMVLLCALYVFKCFFTQTTAGMDVQHVIVLCGLVLFVYLALREMFYHGDIRIFPVIYDSMMDFAALVFILFQMTASFYGTMREVALARQSEQDRRFEAEALRRANKLKEEFLHNLSHELQIPITVVTGFAQLTGDMMDDAAVDREAVKDNMRRVDSEAGRMERLVTQLLDEAAIESGSFSLKKEWLDMTELLDTVSRVHFPIMDRGNNTIRVLQGADLPVIYGDKERLLQVMINLLSNSSKHTHDGTITLRVQAEGKEITVTVEDTGDGIQPELLSHLFKRYPKNRDAGGNGLGLYITARIIEAHGGNINADSVVGKGTVVRFTIPIGEEGSYE